MSRNVNIEAVDLVGAAHRRLAEVASHLSSVHPAKIECDAVRRHLVAVDELISALSDMQYPQSAAAESANGSAEHAAQ